METSTKWIIGGIIAGVAVIVALMVLIPKWNVWRAQKEGEAELARAEQNREVAVREALAKRDAAKMLAEVERAKGVAQANAIVADSLKGHDEYLRYLWIDKLAEGEIEPEYVPDAIRDSIVGYCWPYDVVAIERAITDRRVKDDDDCYGADEVDAMSADRDACRALALRLAKRAEALDVMIAKANLRG